MSITAQKIIDDARVVLNDVAGTRWQNAEMLSWVNAGRRDMASVKPQLWGNTSRRTYTLDSGCYQNMIGKVGFTDIFGLRDIVTNVNADNSVGAAVRMTTRAQLDAYKPDWQTEEDDEVQNWFKDDANHLAFWVYPAAPGAKLSVLVNVQPNDLTSLSETAVPMDVMATALLNYVLYRGYAKDGEIAQNAQLSASYLALFSAALKE